MRYCKKCILPNTRPNLIFQDDGICNACHSHGQKVNIDWQEREKKFVELCQQVKYKKADWDCIIPVSGGKDSTWQVIKALEYGLKPLCVTWRTPARISLGEYNLRNLINLGVDHFDVSINPEVEKKFTLKALKKIGSTALPMHMAIFSIPLNIALKFKIPLVLWGENSAIEYGGDDPDTMTDLMNRKWLQRYGVTHNTTSADWVANDLSANDLKIYEWPSDEEIERNNLKASFLGWYFKWDPEFTFKEAQKYGFKADTKPKTGVYEFADIDDEFIITLHHWIKWYKFGFTRTWDNLSLEIRNGRLSRDEAINKLSLIGDETPVEEIKKFSNWVGITSQECVAIFESFRNLNIWQKKNDEWYLPDFLIRVCAWR